MDSFGKILNIINYLDYRPKYEQEKCIKSISPKSRCSICKDVCSSNAITINQRSISIEENCNTCNKCVSYCPTNALVDTGKKFIGANGRLYLLCEEFKIEDNVDNNFKINCLDYINTKILLNIYKRGYREIYTNLEKCSDCNKNIDLLFELDKTNEILSKLDKPLMSIQNMEVKSLVLKAKEIEKLKSANEVDRRSFFKQLAKEFYSKTYEVTPPASREQFWDSTSHILEKWNENKEKKLSLYNVEINYHKCIQCNACKKLCPQEVWKIDDTTLEERFDLCNGCKLCEDICPTKAIVLKEDIILIDRQVNKKETSNCIRCNKEYARYKKEIEKCPGCIGKEIF